MVAHLGHFRTKYVFFYKVKDKKIFTIFPQVTIILHDETDQKVYFYLDKQNHMFS